MSSIFRLSLLALLAVLIYTSPFTPYSVQAEYTPNILINDHSDTMIGSALAVQKVFMPLVRR